MSNLNLLHAFLSCTKILTYSVHSSFFKFFIYPVYYYLLYNSVKFKIFCALISYIKRLLILCIFYLVYYLASNSNLFVHYYLFKTFIIPCIIIFYQTQIYSVLCFLYQINLNLFRASLSVHFCYRG